MIAAPSKVEKNAIQLNVQDALICDPVGAGNDIIVVADMQQALINKVTALAVFIQKSTAFPSMLIPAVFSTSSLHPKDKQTNMLTFVTLSILCIVVVLTLERATQKCDK